MVIVVVNVSPPLFFLYPRPRRHQRLRARVGFCSDSVSVVGTTLAFAAAFTPLLADVAFARPWYRMRTEKDRLCVIRNRIYRGGTSTGRDLGVGNVGFFMFARLALAPGELGAVTVGRRRRLPSQGSLTWKSGGFERESGVRSLLRYKLDLLSQIFIQKKKE